MSSGGDDEQLDQQEKSRRWASFCCGGQGQVRHSGAILFPVIAILFGVLSLTSFLQGKVIDSDGAVLAGSYPAYSPAYSSDSDSEVLSYPWLDYAAVWRALATDIPLNPKDYHLPQTCRQAVNRGRRTCAAIAAYLAVGFDALKESMDAFTAMGASCLAEDLGEPRRRWCDKAPTKILVVPCAYGREVRAFHAAFPASEIFVADFSADAANWTSAVFGVTGIAAPSGEPSEVTRRLAAVKAPKFQLIWLGSLVTRTSERTTIKWLRAMIDLLDWNGVVVFTFYTPLFHEWDTLNRTGVRIADESLMQALKASFRQNTRYGFAKQDRAISVISKTWVQELSRREDMKDAKVSLVYMKQRAFGPHRLQGVAALGRKYLSS